MTTHTPLLVGAAFLILLPVACGGDSDPVSTPSADKPQVKAISREDAAKQFTLLCVSCHGEGGKGDGPGAAGLTPKPRDFSLPEWQASVTDEHITTVILRGGSAVGKSPGMPPQPHLKSKPGIVLGLIAHVRAFKK